MSPDNRITALGEGTSKSAEVSKLLDTRSVYGSEGTRLLETRGPQHLVKLSSGSEVLARNHVKYSYNEGAPGGEYDLITKTTDGAEYEGGEADVRTTTTSYGGQSNLGWTLRMPTSVTTDPSGLKLTRTTVYDPATGNVLETKQPESLVSSPPPTFAFQVGVEGGGHAQFRGPKGLALDSQGNVWIADDGNHRVQELSPSGGYLGEFGSWGTGEGQFKEPKGLAIDGHGNIWVVDSLLDRVEEFTSAGVFTRQFGKEGTASSEFKEPKAIAIDAHNNVFVADTKNNRVQEFNEGGTFQAMFGYGVSNGETKLQTCTSSCRAGLAGEGNGQMEEPRGIAADSKGDIFVADTDNSRIEEFNEHHEYLKKFGVEGSGNGQLDWPQGITIDSHSNLWVADTRNDRVQEFNENGEYVRKFGAKSTGAGGQFEEPRGVVANAAGFVWVSDTNDNRLQEWAPVNPLEHNTQTIYYSAAPNSEHTGCGGRIEWAGLPCQTQPVAAPESSRTPRLPTSTISYNVWDEPETTVETFGSTTRTKKVGYDEAGRGVSTEETSSLGIAMPPVTTTYSATTGAVVKQSTTVGEVTTAIEREYNSLGQLTKYTDADTNKAEYAYDIDGRVSEIRDGKTSQLGKQTYTYNPTTGFMTELHDSAGTSSFKLTATYDAQGKILTQGYPDGLTATYARNPAGEATGLEYKKASYCGASCTWFSDTLVPSIHGETMKQASTLSEEPGYAYDAAGRLTQIQEAPAGKGCTTRVYAYDEESNRTSLTTRAPTSEGKCASEGGTAEVHAYDPANRINDAGTTYDAFGNALTLPAADAGGPESTSELISSYYVDNQLYKQTEGAKTIEYKLDPEGRTRDTITGGHTTITHYDAPGGALAWTTVEGTQEWTRNIPGIGGELAATQASAGAPILQLHDLNGNIVATAAISETATALLSTYNSTEYGVPTTTNPPPYSWLGASGIAAELPSGIITQGGLSYTPLTGRPIQTESAAPPPPANTITPYVSPALPPWVAQEADTLSAQQVISAEQVQYALQHANQPSGILPSPSGEWCEEEDGCGEVGGELEAGNGGGNAHTASDLPIVCDKKVNNPHNSSHVPGMVNIVVTLTCSEPVFNVRLRVALYFDNGLVAESGYRSFGDTSYARENVAVTCRPGIYQGWGYAEYTLPPNYRPPLTKRLQGWGFAIRIKC